MSDAFSSLPVPQAVADTLNAYISTKSAFIAGGSAAVEFVDGAAFGGHFFSFNRWNEDTTRADIITGTANTPVALGLANCMSPILRRVRPRTVVDGTSASLGLLSGNPTDAVIQQSADYWAAELDAAIVSVLAAAFDASAGVLKDTHVKAVAASSVAIVPISFSNVIKAGALLGDSINELSGIAMHGAQWADACLEAGAKATYIPLGPNAQLVPFLANLRVVLSDSLPTSGSGTFKKFFSVLTRPGAIRVAMQQQIKEFRAVDPDIPAEKISQSLHFAVLLDGVSWNDTAYNVSNATLATASKWTKTATSDKQIGAVALVTNIS